MLRWFVALTPLVGTILLALAVPLALRHWGPVSGVLSALTISTLWFVLMLRTSEMPH